MDELVLPAFRMDCRDWLVVSPSRAGLPEEVGGAPLLAVLSTVALDGDGRATVGFAPASGVLTVGLLEDGDLPPRRPLGPDCVASELIETDGSATGGLAARYLLPAPGGPLALLAEFSFSEGRTPALAGRVERLMASFAWDN